MRLLVLGGQLQGTEITYLAKEAGWTVSVVDKREGVLASRLCDHFICLDILQASPDLFCGFDLVLPALEDLSVLKRVLELTQEAEVPFAFDWQAFVLSRSKIRSNIFLEDLGVRVPLPIEECVLENQKTSAELSGNSKLEQCYIVKPNCSSGSKGVERYRDINAAYARICADPSEGLFGQVFLEGPIYSIEVICNYQLVKPYMVTEVVVDDEYHSHRILAPAPISIELIEKIEDLGMKIGSALNMKGIFDIEMVYNEGNLSVLEIDARMPSQTPIAVYHASGINLVEELARVFLEIPSASSLTLPPFSKTGAEYSRHVVLQHVLAQKKKVSSAHSSTEQQLTAEESVVHFIGEGELTRAPALNRQNGFCGADVALIGNDAMQSCLFATLVAIDESSNLAVCKMDRIVEELALKVAADD